MSEFTDNRVLVVGGSSGIGEAIAQAFVRQGAKVTIASRSEDKLKAAAQRIGQVNSVVLDTADNAAIEAFFAQHHPWDHIAISAAQTPFGLVKELSLSDAYSAMESKFWGAYRLARAAKISERGSLTFVSGFLSVRPGTAVLQGAINAALESLGRGLALELSPVRVNSVSPGIIETPLWDGMPSDTREQIFTATRKALPAKTLGQPEDIARAVLFLAGSQFTSGATLLVDGGGAIQA
ncbi:short-chain dehydrogenase [[Pantoea] beijingensis]|uniref:Short-chain dehydrogenase n=1 Tax=[Pantoea] beijingensis TaxID=1324864 RepID=A0A443IB60_9GAMM|nr:MULTISPECIES: SDR family oxidoreductase [Erwiniaceae]RWR01230.1 short-chain dehydrogenase [[Pantoea] beijingensis]